MPSMPPAKLLARNAAVLLLLGLLTGGFVSAAMTGQVAADPGAALASHLNALMGALWMVAVAATMQWLRYGPKGLSVLAWLTTAPNFANWLVTAVKAFLSVKGISATGEPKNDLIFGLLTALVVLPSIAAAGMWVYGFFGARYSSSGDAPAP